MKYSGLSFPLAALFMVSIWMPQTAIGDNRPDWILKNPTDDRNYQYIVGRSIDSPNDAQAIRTATDDAITQAVRIYGVTAKSQHTTFGNTSRTDVMSRIAEESKAVRLEDFNLQDSFIEKVERGYSAWVLYRYSKGAIAKEKQRLATVSDTSKVDFTEIGNPHAITNGKLEIVSEPPADVYVDGEKVLGKTPLRLIGQLEVGKHHLQIQHDEYQTVERDFVITPTSTTTIKEILKPAYGSISIETNPPSVSVLVGGKFTGTSPIHDLKVPAGKPIRLDFLHIDAEKSSEEIRVVKDEHKVIQKELPLKPAMLQVIVNPAEAKIFVGDTEVKSGWITLKPTSHTITAQKEGYQDGSTTVDLRGGERRTVKINLVPLSLIEKQAKDEERRIEKSPWLFSFGFCFLGKSHTDDPVSSVYGLSFGIEKKFSWIGIKLSYLGQSYDPKSDSGSTVNKYSVSGSAATISLPVYFSDYLYIAPMYGKSKRSYEVSSYGNPSTNPPYTVSQDLYGASVGAFLRSGHWGGGVEGGFIQFSDDGTRKGTSSALINLTAFYAF